MESKLMYACGYGFGRLKSGSCFAQGGVGYASLQCRLQTPQLNITWCPLLAGFDAPDTMQLKEYSMSSGREGIGHNSSWVNPNGNANFPYVNTNGNSNFNWTDDDFNEDWRWLVEVSNSCSSSSASLRRSFFLQSLYPSAEHTPDLIHAFRERDILLGIQRFCFPCNLKEKFEKIEFDACFPQIRQFLFFVEDACSENEFYNIKKQRVYFSAERIPRLFRKMIFILIPLLVYRNESLNDW